MSDDVTRSSANVDPQLLSEGDGIMLRDFNPKGMLRFGHRICMTCDGPIMSHWILYHKDTDLRAEYWCDHEGTRYSEGMK